MRVYAFSIGQSHPTAFHPDPERSPAVDPQRIAGEVTDLQPAYRVEISGYRMLRAAGKAKYQVDTERIDTGVSGKVDRPDRIGIVPASYGAPAFRVERLHPDVEFQRGDRTQLTARRLSRGIEPGNPSIMISCNPEQIECVENKIE